MALQPYPAAPQLAHMLGRHLVPGWVPGWAAPSPAAGHGCPRKREEARGSPRKRKRPSPGLTARGPAGALARVCCSVRTHGATEHGPVSVRLVLCVQPRAVQPWAREGAATSGPTGAPSPAEVTHGITLRGAQLTRAILTGDKRVENRHFTMKPGWYALHTGAKMSSHESQHALLASLRAMPGEASLPHCAIVGAVQISHALSFDECKGTEPWAFGPVCNVIQAVATLQRPVAHRGALSLWRIDAAALEDVRSQLSEACVHTNDLSHLPPPPAIARTIKVKGATSRAYDRPPTVTPDLVNPGAPPAATSAARPPCEAEGTATRIVALPPDALRATLEVTLPHPNMSEAPAEGCTTAAAPGLPICAARLHSQGGYFTLQHYPQPLQPAQPALHPIEVLQRASAWQ